VRNLASKLAPIAGGVTCSKGEGFYVSETGELIQEPVTVVTIFINITDPLLEKIYAIAKAFCNNMKQECILMKVNGRAYLIPPN
jgi:hypothetical protein